MESQLGRHEPPGPSELEDVEIMPGWTRKERNKELMTGLGLPYDDGIYVRLAEIHKIDPVSMRQAAERAGVVFPMDRKNCTLAEKGLYKRPAHLLKDSPELRRAREQFKKTTVVEVNKRLRKELQPQLDLLEMMATNSRKISKKKSRVLSIEFMTEIAECSTRETGYYYYEPVQELWLHCRNNHLSFRLI